MIEYILMVYLYTANPKAPSGYDWTLEAKGVYQTKAACLEAARKERVDLGQDDSGRVVVCRDVRQK